MRPQSAPEFRHGLGFLGIEVEEKQNGASEDVISPLDSQVSVRVIHTDEERMIAKSVGRVVGGGITKEVMKMKINSKDFRVRPGEKVKLKEWPTMVKPFCKSKKQYQKLLEEHVEELSSLQHLHYASNRYALLLIFQGMDAGGKDGAIRHVMSGVNPEGCEVFSFKQPSAEELEHDFLWRTTCRLPERGRIGIFNRSYYEEVLVVRVHPEILRSQGLSEELRDEKTIWKERYRSIVDLENHLYRNGTTDHQILPAPVEGRTTKAIPRTH